MRRLTNSGWSTLKATVTTLTSGSDTYENSLASPTNVSPAVTQIAGLGPTFNYTLQPYSLKIFRLSLNASDLVSVMASAGGGGSIAPQGSLLLPLGTNQSFSIVPSVNYVVADVQVDGVSQGVISNYTFTHSKLAPCHALDFRANVKRCQQPHRDTFRLRCRLFIFHCAANLRSE
jgi:hypothetical protein